MKKLRQMSYDGYAISQIYGIAMGHRAIPGNGKQKFYEAMWRMVQPLVFGALYESYVDQLYLPPHRRTRGAVIHTLFIEEGSVGTSSRRIYIPGHPRCVSISYKHLKTSSRGNLDDFYRVFFNNVSPERFEVRM